MGYIDAHKIPEHERILMIGVAAETQVVGVMLETKEPEKIARYIKGVTEQFPKVVHLSTTEGITPLVSLVKFGPKPN